MKSASNRLDPYRPAMLLALLAGVLIAPPAAMAQQVAPPDQGEPAPAAVLDDVAPEPPAVVSTQVIRVGKTPARLVKLDNGLTVILMAVRTAPVVSVRAYVHTGGMYEREFLGAGLSHLLEHLVAKESIHESPGGGGPHGGTIQPKRTRTLEIGGQSNAYTSLNHTCYYIAASSTKTMECIDLIADQMARPGFTRADFTREHGVVQRELEMGRDDPNRQMWYAHAAHVFRGHPASVPVIGYMPVLREVTWQDIQTYHKRMYVPQNMVFTVVGDIDVDKALAKVREQFAGFTRGLEPKHRLPEIQPLSGVSVVNRPHKTLNDVMGRMSFQTIPLQHEDLYALDVLSYILSRGRTSRLYQAVVLDRIGTQISTSSWTPSWGKGIFTISYRCDAEKVGQLEQTVRRQLQRVITEGVTAGELARAKRQKQAELVYSQQTVDSLAGSLASDYLSTGNALFSQMYVDRIKQVTAEQVRSMAEKYFTFDRMAVTRLVPEGFASAAMEEAQAADETRGRLIQLDNGLKVVLQPAPGGLVSMVLATRGGILRETPEVNGIGSLMMNLTTRGAGNRSADEIAGFFQDAGGGISGNCGNNTFYWSATVLSDSFTEAMDIFADVVQRPTFPQDELKILKPIQIQSIRRTDEHWSSQLQAFFRQSFFAQSPYRMLSSGSVESVEDLDVEDLREWHETYIRAGDSVLTIYGSFDPDQAETHVRRLFQALPAGSKPVEQVAARSVPAEGKTYVKKTANQQAGVIVAVPGMRVQNLDDRLAITVLDTIMSGYRLPSGWLHTELRGKSLVYVVHAYNWAGLLPGAFVTYAGTQPDKAGEVVDIIHKYYRQAATYKPSEKEVRQAVNIILTADVLGNQTMQSQAMSAALDELYGFGWDFSRKQAELYQKITPADVRAVGAKYFSGGLLTVVTTPQPDKLKQADSLPPAAVAPAE